MTTKVKMNSNRKTAIIVGVLFIIGTVAGILSGVFAGFTLADPDYLIKVSANENRIIIGALLILIMGFALAMVPVVMFPIFKKYNEVLALGYVVFRGALETVTYMATVINFALLITLSQEYVKAGAPEASYFQTLGTLSQGASDFIPQMTAIVFSLGALMFYYLWYISKLIPRWLSVWGFIGATLSLAAGLLGIFGLVIKLSGSEFEILWAPIALNEMVLAVWLIVKGFNSSAIASESAKVDIDEV
jgi:hypothetical protein